LGATHRQQWFLFDKILSAYRQSVDISKRLQLNFAYKRLFNETGILSLFGILPVDLSLRSTLDDMQELIEFNLTTIVLVDIINDVLHFLPVVAQTQRYQGFLKFLHTDASYKTLT